MGRPKAKQPDEPLPDRLGLSKPEPVEQTYLPDGDGGNLAPVKIEAIETAAENWRGLRERIADLKEKLDIDLYPKLKEAFIANKHLLGPSGVYQYYDANDEKREVAMDEEPKVSVRKVKKPKKNEDGDEGHGINPGGDDESLNELDNDAA